MIGNIAQSIESLYSMHEILNRISNIPEVLMWFIKSFSRESFWDESLAPSFLLVAIAQFAPREMTATKGDASDGATMTWNRKEGYRKSFLLFLDPHTRWPACPQERSRLSRSQASLVKRRLLRPSWLWDQAAHWYLYSVTGPHTPVCWSTVEEGLGNMEAVQVQTNMHQPDASNIHLYDGFSLWILGSGEFLVLTWMEEEWMKTPPHPPLSPPLPPWLVGMKWKRQTAVKALCLPLPSLDWRVHLQGRLVRGPCLPIGDV